METIPFNDIKRDGVAAIEAALKEDTRAVITVRGQLAYVIMGVAEYNELRDAELLNLAAEARKLHAEGKLKAITAEEHMAEIDALIAAEAETDAV